MLINSKSTSSTITFTAMETLTFQVPEDCSAYFLDFSTKEEYFAKRSEWRELYKCLSKAIRHNKAIRKASQKAWAKVYRRMNKKGRNQFSTSLSREDYSKGREEFSDRLKRANESIPKVVSEMGLDPTELLAIRKLMEEESSKQRKLAHRS